MDFSDRILITNPTVYNLGKGIAFIAVADLLVGATTYFLDDVFFMPPLAWCILAAPKLLVGMILIFCGLTKA